MDKDIEKIILLLEELSLSIKKIENHIFHTKTISTYYSNPYVDISYNINKKD